MSLARFLSSRLLSCCKCFRLLSRRSTLNRNSKQARNRAGPPRGCSHIRRLRSRYLPTTREQRSAGFVLPFVRQWLSIASASSGGSPVSLRFSAGNKLSDDEAGEKQTSDEVVQRCPVLSVFTNSRSISARDAMLCKGVIVHSRIGQSGVFAHDPIRLVMSLRLDQNTLNIADVTFLLVLAVRARELELGTPVSSPFDTD